MIAPTILNQLGSVGAQATRIQCLKLPNFWQCLLPFESCPRCRTFIKGCLLDEQPPRATSNHKTSERFAVLRRFSCCFTVRGIEGLGRFKWLMSGMTWGVQWCCVSSCWKSISGCCDLVVCHLHLLIIPSGVTWFSRIAAIECVVCILVWQLRMNVWSRRWVDLFCIVLPPLLLPCVQPKSSRSVLGSVAKFNQHKHLCHYASPALTIPVFATNSAGIHPHWASKKHRQTESQSSFQCPTPTAPTGLFISCVCGQFMTGRWGSGVTCSRSDEWRKNLLLVCMVAVHSMIIRVPDMPGMFLNRKMAWSVLHGQRNVRSWIFWQFTLSTYWLTKRSLQCFAIKSTHQFWVRSPPFYC